MHDECPAGRHLRAIWHGARGVLDIGHGHPDIPALYSARIDFISGNPGSRCCGGVGYSFLTPKVDVFSPPFAPDSTLLQYDRNTRTFYQREEMFE
ncbi:hypothetical protein J6590_032802 [Homalodisca vitripennis]|nr:hypothetical protein J6590_032802 [Homalodisca vitripennis]